MKKLFVCNKEISEWFYLLNANAPQREGRENGEERSGRGRRAGTRSVWEGGGRGASWQMNV